MEDTYYEIQDEHGENVGECYDRTLGQAIERALFTACAIAGLGPLYCVRIEVRTYRNVRPNRHGKVTRTATQSTAELELCEVFEDRVSNSAPRSMTAGEERMFRAVNAAELAQACRARIEDTRTLRRYGDSVDARLPGLLQAA